MVVKQSYSSNSFCEKYETRILLFKHSSDTHIRYHRLFTGVFKITAVKGMNQHIIGNLETGAKVNDTVEGH